MNKIGLNILLVLLLTGCVSKKTDSKGEPVGRNAPIFITPKTNQVAANNAIKSNTNEISVNKPASVSFNAEKYVMIKESDLNILVNQKTNEVLLNIKNSNANEKEPNKELDAALDSHIKNSVAQSIVNFTPNPIKLERAIEPEKVSNKSIHPIFAFVLTALTVLGFVLAAGYFFFIKKRSDENASTTNPQSPKVATQTAAENSSNKDPQAKAD
jgi:hypothetical protein